MTTRKIVLKKVKVGTPIKTVTAGSFGINNLGGVDTTGRTTGSLLVFNQSSGNFEPVTLTGDSNHFLTFDSSSTPDTLQINFTNDSISGSLIPKLDSAFDLGSSTKKWKDLFLSGSTITLGDLTIQSTGGGIEVKDSDGNTLLQNIKYITVNGDTDILAYDSNTSTFTFNDSDIARTDEIETFHKAIKVTDSAEITSNLTVGGNLTVVGDLQYDDVSADSAVFSGSVAIGNNLTADSATITKIANTTLTGKNATFDSATIGNLAATNLVISSGDSAFFNKVAIGDLEVDSANIDRLTLDSGQVRQLSTGFINADSAFMDSATISTIATGTINADQQFTDSATITNIANSVLTAKVITNTTLTNATLTSDSATITNIASSQLTIDNATFDSSAHNTLHANALTVDSGDIRQLSVDFINADSAFFDSATITNLSTTQITFSQATLDSATINTLNVDSSDIRQFSTEFINFDSAFGDSATITNIANTQLTGSQATLDSATITKLNVDSSDIDHLSTEAINFDSATGDSATITSIANSTFTGKVITGTNVAFDSATITNVAIATQLTGDQASFDSVASNTLHATNLSVDSGDIRQLSVDFINADSAFLDSATITTLAVGTLNIDAINIGDSATFTNIASNSINTNALQVDDLTVDGSTISGTDITFDMSGDITLDVDGSEIFLKDGGTQFGVIYSQDNNLNIKSHLADQDIVFRGNDNNSEIIALRLDMSDAGTAIFNHDASFADDGIAKFGASDDLQIYHDASNSYVRHVGTGNLNISGDEVRILNQANDELKALFTTDGSVELYFDNTKRLETKDSGVAITGTLSVDSATLTNLTGDSATITNIANSVLTAKAITGTTVTTSGDIVSSGTIRAGNLNVDSADIDTIAKASLLGGTGVTYDSSSGVIAIGQPVATTDSVTFSGLTIGGNLVVSGTTTTVATTNTTMTDQLFELGNGRTGSPSGDAGIVIEMGDDSNAFIGFDQSLGKFVVSRTNATGSSTGNLVHTTAPLVVGGLTADSIGGTLTTAAQPNVTSLGTLTALTVDNTAIDGDTISNATSNDMLLDAGGGIILDAEDNGTISFRDGGTRYGVVEKSSDNFHIQSMINDGDVKILGKDGSSTITAVTFDMSEAGKATFNSSINLPDNGKINLGAGEDLQIYHDGSNSIIADAGTGSLFLRGTNEVNIQSAIGSNYIKSTNGAGTKIFFNDAEKFETTDSGVNITGQLLADSATLTNLTVDSADIRQLSVDFINADSAFLDSATITTLAVGTLNIDNINIGDSATFTNVAVSTALNTNSLQVDDITMDGFTISQGSGNMRLDISGTLFLDADTKIDLEDGGSTYGRFSMNSTSSKDFIIQSVQQDKDIFFKGDDGGSTITALTLDMSDAGRALFNGSVDIGGTSITRTGDLTIEPSGDLILDAGGENIKFKDDGVEVGQIDMGSQNLTIRSSVSDKDVIFRVNDGGSEITAMTIDASEAGQVLITGDLRVGNLPVDSADLITLARSNISGRNGLAYNSSTGVFDLDSANAITTVKNALSTGSPDALTYDSAAGQFALNANHVMALIQTVDSNGSGLNADTLEGQAGSHYRINVYNASGSLLN